MQRIVITGGPGAGKTALLEVLRRRTGPHVLFVPESASLLYRGGFPRAAIDPAQRAIYHVQRELESAFSDGAVVLCDRGTVDGAAYWRGDPAELWRQVGTTRDAELARYEAVVHLRTAPPSSYNHSNPVRLETAREAERIDRLVEAAWDGHPRRRFVASEPDFLEKIRRSIEVLHELLPAGSM
jgi:predicted ATPase